MGRILAIDFGRKRTGIAVTDCLKIVANGLDTVPTHKVVEFLKQYTAKEPVELIVVGEPKKLDNTPSECQNYLRPFLKKLRDAFPDMPIEMFDERFTSTIAHQSMLSGGARKSTRQNKDIVDTIAATIILNDYLQSKQRFNNI
ncbi:MAG: Holliday junction resolvase RuvX [Muribaculaceae bacterium]